MIKCVAIDDEPIALNIIQEYCNRLGNIELQCFTSPIAGMECIRTTKPDIVFLDIEMNSHNGIELARELPRDCCLIFTTAYAQYALEGFEVDAVDFLHKPIFFNRFERALSKARTWLDGKKGVTGAGSISLRSSHKNVLISLDDILLIEAMDNYVKVFRNGQPTVISQITMKEMEEMLPRERFARVHRSFIVALGAIDRYSNRLLSINGYKHQVPVGRKYSESFNSIYSSMTNKSRFDNKY